MFLLDINDTEITFSRDDEILYRQPGIALVERNATLLGNDAAAQSRLHPRQAHNEFWQRLNADPVTPAGRAVANQADLVYLQLGAIRQAAGIESADLVVAAPSAVTHAQLGMLLGIAAEAGFNIRVVVDSAVAGASGQTLTGSCRAVDITLQRAIVTQLDIDESNTLSRGATEEVPAAGFAALVEGWVDAVADQFVESTRFDPLRIAATEQQVFDQLLTGVDPGNPELAVAIEHDGISRQVTVSRRAFAEKSRQRYALLAAAIGTPGTLLISHRVRKLPGLATYLQEAGHRIIALPSDAVASAIQRHPEVFQPNADATSGVQLVSALPLLAAASDSATQARPPATHLLCGALALPLTDELDASNHPACNGSTAGFRIRRDGDGFRAIPTGDNDVLLNGEPLDFDHRASTGDRLTSGNEEFRLIAVVDG